MILTVKKKLNNNNKYLITMKESNKGKKRDIKLVKIGNKKKDFRYKPKYISKLNVNYINIHQQGFVLRMHKVLLRISKG